MHKFKEALWRFFQFNTFRKKLLLTIIACTAVPILFSMANIIYTSMNVVKEQTIQSERYNLQLADMALKNQIDDLIRTMNFVHFDDDIRRSLNESIHGISTPRVFLELNSKLDQMTRNSNISIVVIPANGEHFFSNHHFSGDFDKNKLVDWTRQLDGISTFQVYGFNAGEIAEGREEGHLLANNDQRILLGKRLTKYTGETLAYIFAGLNDLALNELDHQADYNRELLLVDESGFILHDHNENNIGNEFSYYDRVLSDDGSFMMETDNGDQFLYVSQPLQFQEWSLISYVPYDEAIDELNRAYTFNVYVMTGGLIALVIILLFIVNTFTRPISKLAGVAKEIESGNLAVRSHINRHDEIGRLSTAFDTMLDRIQTMFLRLKEEQTIKRRAEIAVLQNKIKPHFIFNVLNTIRIQSHKTGDRETSELIVAFNKFLRRVYRGEEWLTFEEEVNHTKDYTHLMNSMRKSPVKLMLNVDSSTLNVKVPRFFIQPLVENALKHGIKQGDGSITVTAGIKDDIMTVTVADNGTGLKKEDLACIQNDLKNHKADMTSGVRPENESSQGIGLKNVYDRMLLFYGDEFHMSIESQWQTGVTIYMSFPLKGGRTS